MNEETKSVSTAKKKTQPVTRLVGSILLLFMSAQTVTPLTLDIQLKWSLTGFGSEAITSDVSINLARGKGE